MIFTIRVSVVTLVFVYLSGGLVLAGTLATWDPTIHGGDDINYSDQNNWDPNTVPINNGITYDVTIPGSEAVTFDAGVSGNTVDTFSLGLGSTFHVNSGLAYNVLGVSDIGGTISVDASTFSSPSATALFSGRPFLFAQAGGTVNLGASSLSATYSANSQTIMQADNGSITLGSLSSLTANESTSFIDTLTIHALNGGTIDLSAVTSASSNDLLKFKTDSGGTINLTALTTTNNVRFEINGASFTLLNLANTTGTQFDAGVGQTITADALLTHDGGSFNLQTGSAVNLAALTSMRNASFAADTGTTFNAPNLADVAGSTLTLDPNFTFTTSSLSNIDGARIFVNGGLNFSPVTASDYNGSFANNSETILRADGTGSTLDLSSLNSIVADESTSFVDILTIHSRNNGMVDLSNVTSASSNDILRFLVESGGSIDLSSLTSVSNVEFEIHVPIFSVNALIQATNSTFDLKGGTTFNATSLTSMTGTTFGAGTGAVFNAPNLVDVSGSTLNLDSSFTFTTGPLGNVNSTRLFVSDGKNFNSVSATSYTGSFNSNSETIMSASGVGTVLDLSSLTSFTANETSSFADTLTVLAENSGKVDLSHVVNLSTNDQLQIRATSMGEIDLSSLQSVTGTTFFTVDAESTLKLGNFTVTGNTTFNINDATSVVQVAGSLLLDAPAVFNVATAGGVSVGGNFSFASQSEASLNIDDGILSMVGTGTFAAPQFLEVGGEDLGILDPNDPTAIPGTDGNFAIGQLVIGDPNQTTVVELLDAIDNGNGPGLEALYLPGFGGDGLRMFGGSRLIIESINVYAFLDGSWIHLNSLFGGGVTSIPLSDLVSDPEANGFIGIPEPATMALCLLALTGWRSGRRENARISN